MRIPIVVRHNKNQIVLLSSGDSFRHLIQKRRSQLGFVTYLLNYLSTYFHCRLLLLYSGAVMFGFYGNE